VTICREWSLVKSTETERRAHLLHCRSWSCPLCAPDRRRQLMAAAAGGDPKSFLTLTVNPSTGTSPEDRRSALGKAFGHLIKRLRRDHPDDEIEYLAVVEATEAGEPHLHVLLRAPFIPQAEISRDMDELIGAPVVDIRRVKSLREVVRYVAKYIAKEPARFGTSKRYWSSRGYELVKFERKAKKQDGPSPWYIDRRPWREIIIEWTYQGFAVRRDGDEALFGIPAPPGSLSALSGLPRIEVTP